jgi:hypothetical protein
MKTDAEIVGEAVLDVRGTPISVELSNGRVVEVRENDSIMDTAQRATNDTWDAQAGLLSWIFPDRSIIDTIADDCWCVR